uniref:Uncharacterized protein n=1 Tax=Glossina palpalis gambiensis TaxID=67801 RepID=A0A1B0BXT0_9MUSC
MDPLFSFGYELVQMSSFSGMVVHMPMSIPSTIYEFYMITVNGEINFVMFIFLLGCLLQPKENK